MGKCEALRPGVHLIFLYFIRISLLSAETFFLFWCGCGCGCGWRTFFVFKSFDNNMVYSLGTDIYIYAKGIFAEQKSYGFKKLMKLKTVPMKTKIPIGRRILCLSSKTSFFEGLGTLLGTFLGFFSTFLNYK